jgi:hypothetical protein
MTKINEDLSPESHQKLRAYQYDNDLKNKGAALNGLIADHAELDYIVRRLASCYPPHDDIGCVLCDTPGFEDKDHDENCPWKMAKARDPFEKIKGDLKRRNS